MFIAVVLSLYIIRGLRKLVMSSDNVKNTRLNNIYSSKNKK